MIQVRAIDLFVDTSGWGYHLDRGDPLHLKTEKRILSAVRQGRKLVTTNYIVHELVALLTSPYNVPRPQIIKAINSIKTDKSVIIIHIDEATEDDAWKLLEKYQDKEWSLVDATSFIVMKRYGMSEALTSDHHFEQANFIKLLSH